MLSEKYLDTLFAKLDSMKVELSDMARTMWENPELGHQEYIACELMASMLEKANFNVERKAANMDTAFFASKKSSKPGPKVAFVAEYDALPEIGHACAHNLFASAAVGAGIAISEMLEEIGGEVLVIGSPAEEGVVENNGGKIFLIEEGYFKGVDACFIFHGEDETVIERSLVTSMAIKAEFKGYGVHAGGSPQMGINALTAGMLTLNNTNAMRQQFYPGDSLNGVMYEGGIMPNTIPEYCEMAFSTRAKTKKNLHRVVDMLKRSVEAAALVTGCEHQLHVPARNYEDTLCNHEMGLVLAKIFDKLGVVYSQFDERDYAWDVGNISYVCPVLASYIKIGPKGILCHTDEFKQASNSEGGYNGMMVGAKGMAATALEFYLNEEFRKKVKHEFDTVER